MKRLSFAQWLRLQRKRWDPVGDLARDVAWDRREGGFTGKKLRTRDGWHRHLDETSACQGAHDALDEAWHEWQREISASVSPAGIRNPTP